MTPYLLTECVTHEGVSGINYDPLLGHNDWVCSDSVCCLVKSGSFTCLLETKCQSGLFCVYNQNLSLRLLLHARRANQHFRVLPTFPMATGDAVSP